MQRVISFDKSLEFKTMIGEVTSISLDQELSFSDESTVSGELIISGKYKLTSASRLEEDFVFHLPVEIVLTEKLEEDGRSVTIEDFRYEIEEDDVLNCHISLLVEGVEAIEIADDSSGEDLELESSDDVLEIKEDNCIESRECDSGIEESTSSFHQDIILQESVQNKQEANVKDNVKMEEDKKDIEESNASTGLFSSFKDSDETFATYSVYIFRQNDTIEMVMDKYQVSREELESYNDLSSLTVGTKIIVPTNSHE